MKLAKDATKPLAILSGVLDHFSVEFRPTLMRDAGLQWLGFFLEKKDFPAITKIVGPDGKVTGWFGYHPGDPEGPRLCVELYPGTDRQKQWTLKTLKRDLPNARLREPRDLWIEVFCRPEDSPGDMEWFIKVLTTLNK